MRSLARSPSAAAVLTAGLVVLLAAVPAPLLPLAHAYRDLCDRFPILAVLTNHAPALPLALILLLGIIAFANGGRVVGTTLLGSYRFNRGLRSCPPPRRLVRLGSSLGLADRLMFLDHSLPAAFCFGFLQPKVAVTSGLLARLDEEELLAVLAHEREHVRRRDPLRYLIVHAMSAAAFMLPLSSCLRARVETRIEVAADRAAMVVASPGALAGALLVVLAGPRIDAVGTARLGATEARIAHLAGDAVLPPVPIGASVASLALLLAIALALVTLAASADLVRMACELCVDVR